MYGVLKSHITLGNYTFTQVHDVQIEKSVDMLSDTATIKMPTSFLLGNENESFKRKLEDELKTGDSVVVSLGYDGIIFKEEFKGYVKAIKPNTPLEIECEDAIYLIRQKKSINKLFVKAQLRDILAEITSGTGVEISGEIPELILDRFLLKNINGAKALQKIKEEFGLAIYIDDNGRLYAGLQQQLNATNKVKYHLQKQTIIEENDLQFTKEEDVKLRIKAVGVQKDNTRVEIEVGDTDGEQRTYHFYNISDKAKLKEIAESKLKQMKYTGYKGSLTSFLSPNAERGWSAEITDGNYPNKSGTYFIEKVSVSFGTNGARRVVTLGRKI